MTALSIYNQSGQKVRDLQAPEAFAAGPIRYGLIYYVVRQQRAAKRAGTHSTKTRGMVAGTTKKIYRQKGTGQARHGSNKAPIFVGGGITFGPQPRDYSYSMPKTARRAGLQSALALKHKENKMIVLEPLNWLKPKTKQAQDLFAGLKAKEALVVLDAPNVAVERSIRNLKGFQAIIVDGLNVYDILRFDHLILMEAALPKLYQRLHVA